MSTPIETNTEQLQEVLQQVYNLPNSSGGSTTPDLVISFVANEGGSYLTHDSVVVSNFSIKSGSVQSTYTKLMNREEVKVILEHEYWYGLAKYTGVWNPVQVCAKDYTNEDIEVEEHGLGLIFCADEVPGYSYHSIVSLLLDLDGTVHSAGYKRIV